MKILKDYVQNAYYHCLQYTVNKRLHWSERVFWIICALLSTAGALYVVMASMQKQSKSAFRVHVNYMAFKTPFPTIAFCERRDEFGKTKAYLESLNESVSENDIEFLKSAIYYVPFETAIVNGPCYRTYLTSGSINDTLCPLTRRLIGSFSQHEYHVKSACADLLTSCYYNGAEFECCEKFLPLPSYMGKCFAINSLAADLKKNNIKASNREDIPPLTYYISHRPGLNPGNLSVEVAHSYMSVWFMTPNGLPSKASQKNHHFITADYANADLLDVHLRIEAVVGVSDLANVPLEERGCRFIYESKDMKTFIHYSMNGCEIECLREAQIFHCGCKAHVLPTEHESEDAECDSTGLNCLTELKKKEVLERASTCDCVSDCNSLEVFKVGYIPKLLMNASFRNSRSKKRINFLVPLPAIRYERVVLRGTIDLIVSVGGALSLFIGCSYMSIGQLIYYFFIKATSDFIVQRRRMRILKKMKFCKQTFAIQRQKLVRGH
ncbi:sodium channel protein Nach-like isoform X2 [Cylas formicarius]|uniref:sodium channel protein Nach-like isoform X2 n=1 Tax=Cylas formicarius TaxID=197179 RepID=UPI0029584BBF|nr:sodium channel protein Nach-like isoform X2 [Cylas formicarius]